MNATDHHDDTVVDTDEPQSCWCVKEVSSISEFNVLGLIRYIP